MKKQIIIVSILALLCLALTSVSQADIYMKQKQHTDAMSMMGQQTPAEDLISETWISDKGFVSNNPKTSMIMMLADRKMLVVNHQDKTYMEMPMNFAELAAQMPGGEEGENSEEMQGMMQNMMNMQAVVKTTNETKKINNWNSKKYLVSLTMMMGTMEMEIWASEDISIDNKQYEKYTEAMLSMIPGLQNSMDKTMKEMQKIKGVQVYSKTDMKVMNQNVSTSSELLEYKQGTAPSGIFAVPAGYKKQQF